VVELSKARREREPFVCERVGRKMLLRFEVVEVLEVRRGRELFACERVGWKMLLLLSPVVEGSG
jgi:hypothetical protein